MKHEGPSLEALLHRLSHCPAELVEHAAQSPRLVAALVCDYFRKFEPAFEAESIVQRLSQASAKNSSWMPIAVWLLSHSWFLSRRDLQPQLAQLFFSERLSALAQMVNAHSLVNDPDRREELVRIVLTALDLRPAGETVEQALDRLNTLDTVERKRILQATLAAEKRAREIREAMARAKAQESASRYGE